MSERVFQVASWPGSSVTTPMAGPPLAASCSSWLLPWYVYNLNVHVLMIRLSGASRLCVHLHVGMPSCLFVHACVCFLGACGECEVTVSGGPGPVKGGAPAAACFDQGIVKRSSTDTREDFGGKGKL